MTRDELERLRAEAAALTGGLEPRTTLAALAMHAAILNLHKDAWWPPDQWYGQMAECAVRSADEVIAALDAAERVV